MNYVYPSFCVFLEELRMIVAQILGLLEEMMSSKDMRDSVFRSVCIIQQG